MGPYRDGAMEAGRRRWCEGESLEATAPKPIGSMRSGISYRVRLRWLCFAFHQLSRHMNAHAPAPFWLVGGSMRGMDKAAAPPRLIGRVAVAVAAAWASPTALPAAAGQRPACPSACAVRATRLGTATAAAAALLRAAFRVVAGLPRRAPRTRNNLPAFDRSTFLACALRLVWMVDVLHLHYTVHATA